MKTIAHWIIASMLCFCIPTLGYVTSAYQHLGYDYFETYIRYDTTTLSPGSGNDDFVAFGYLGLDFSFKNLAYNLRIIPVVLEDAQTGTTDEISWTVHNIHWQLFKDYDYGLFKLIKPGVQIGLTNIGLPKTTLSQNTALSNYLSSYYIMTESHLFKNPRINLYYGINFNAEVDNASTIVIAEYEYNKNKIYYEMGYDTSYLGLVLFLSEYKHIEFGINLAGNADTDLLDASGNFIDSNNDGIVDVSFNPVYSISIHIQNPINQKKKKKMALTPLNVDENMYLEMEKGLINFYDQNYKKSLLHYNNVIKKYPSFGLGHVRLGNTYYQLKNYSLAEWHWKTALKYNISNPEEVVYFLKKLEAKQLELDKYLSED